MSELITVKTSELEGAALDWAAAQIDPMCEGLKWMRVEESPLWAGFAEIDGESTICAYLPLSANLREQRKARAHLSERYSPSTDWSRGGPLIERYNLTLSSPKSSVHRNGGPLHGWGESGVWSTCTWEKGVNGKRATGYHESSALTATMRTIVKFELGDTVDVPKELVT